MTAHAAPACGRWRAAVGRALAAVALLAGVVAQAGAHTGGTTGFAALRVEGTTVRWSLTLPLETLPAEWLKRTGLDDPARTPDFAPLLAEVATRVHLASAGGACAPVPRSADATSGASRGVTIVIDHACPAPMTRLVIRDDLADTFGDGHHTLAKLEGDGMPAEPLAFAPDRREIAVDLAATPAAGPTSPSGFFPLGVEHILIGFDHLLFLLALVLRGGDAWSLLKIVTAFTVAHSITLGLAALDVVQLPSAWVEAVIAASIAWVAAENLWRRERPRHRWVTSFVFGLVHGFGFSGVLREIGLPSDGLVWALLSFNVGVEVGQALAVGAVLPLLLWLRRSRIERPVVRGLSAAVLAVGVVLTAMRVFAP
ncbi:MAG: HupE/UreJ family protein [Burkholderiales bacterium]|nr:HupE/UreJ family protein [Burkholderiales bacterium]